jgi:hypothetical protein
VTGCRRHLNPISHIFVAATCINSVASSFDILSTFVNMPSLIKGTRLEGLFGYNTRRGASPSILLPSTPYVPAAKVTSGPGGLAAGPAAGPGPRAESASHLLASWIIGGVLTVLVPLISRSHKMRQYQMYNNNYNNNGNNNGNNNNAQNGGQQGSGGGDGSWDVNNNCKWYQLNCKSYYVNQNGGAGDNQGYNNSGTSTPGWFSGWASSSESQAPGALRFVYCWQIVLFLAILAYGFLVIKKRRPTAGLLGMLLIWANVSFLSMLMLADASIVVDDRDLESSGGFYGQFSVLVFLTNAWYTIFGVIFSMAFACFVVPSPGEGGGAGEQKLLASSSSSMRFPKSSSKNSQNVSSNDYQAYTETPVTQQAPSASVSAPAVKAEEEAFDDDFVQVV